MSDPWRYACPDGHTAFRYRPSTETYYCRACQAAGDDPHFEEKLDRKTSDEVTP